MQHHLSDQEIIRRENLQELRNLGLDPYPEFDPEAGNFQEVCLAGRLMSSRVMGKASFAELQDSSGRIQLYISRDEICPGENKDLYNIVYKKLLDLGDFIGVKGYAFLTKTGELTVHVTELKLLSKSLRPLPVVKTRVNEETGETEVYDAFSDPELRYRQRYVDLTVNAHVKETFLKRSRIISAMRRYFDAQGWLEVETPILQPVHDRRRV